MVVRHTPSFLVNSFVVDTLAFAFLGYGRGGRDGGERERGLGQCCGCNCKRVKKREKERGEGRIEGEREDWVNVAGVNARESRRERVREGERGGKD